MQSQSQSQSQSSSTDGRTGSSSGTGTGSSSSSSSSSSSGSNASANRASASASADSNKGRGRSRAEAGHPSRTPPHPRPDPDPGPRRRPHTHTHPHPDPDQFDIACAIDALSCVESGDPSVLDIISQTAYDLRIEDSSSSTSSNCSTSSFEDDENNEVVHNTSVQSEDEDDLNDDYPVDALKVAALSSAFSSHHISPKRSKMHRVHTSFNEKIEPQQMAQFLLPLFSSQAEEVYSDPHNLKIKHEDILHALTGSSCSAELSNMKSEELISLEELSYESTLSLEEKEMLLQFKKILTSTDLRSVLKMPSRSPTIGDTVKSGISSNCVTSLTESKDSDLANSFGTSIMTTNIVSSDTNEVSFTKEIDDYLMRECCTNKFLAEGGKCLVNECHKRWELIKEGLIKYILRSNNVGCALAGEDEPVDDIYVPQMIFDCDSLNIHERFLYGNQNHLCPGGCANPKPCKRFSQYYKLNVEKDGRSKPPDAKKGGGGGDEEIKFIDMQAAWHELKILLLCLYWAANNELNDFDELAIGFQISCNCCYCFHANIITRLEKLKCFNLSVKEPSSIYGRCTCRKKKIVGKGRGRTKTRFKSDLHGKDSVKCQYCITADNEYNHSLKPMKTKLAHYFKILGLPVVECCCRSQSDLILDEELPPVFLCSKSWNSPCTYVDLLSGLELSVTETESKVSSSTRKFYAASWEKFCKGNNSNAEKSFGSDSVCQRCRCSCNNAKFYNITQIASRITEIIDNFARLSIPFLLNKMDTFYSALCARYGARLLILNHSPCGFTFLKDLAQIVRSLRECGLWLMQILGPSRLRLSFTIYFTLPGQHFLNNIFWHWADVPALDYFLKLCVMLARDTVPSEWRDILLAYLDVLPYLNDAATLSDISDIFSYTRQDFDKDEHLFQMYRSYISIQKKFFNRPPVLNRFNKFCEEQPESQDSNLNFDAMLKFSKSIGELIKTKKLEYETLPKFWLDAWNDFEKLLTYAMIKAYAVGDCIENVFSSCWIEKVFKSQNDSDASTNSSDNVKRYLQILVDSMACHKNVINSKGHDSINQTLLESNPNRIKNLVKVFHMKHLKHSQNKWLKTDLNISQYAKYNKDLTKADDCLHENNSKQDLQRGNADSKSEDFALPCITSHTKRKFKAVNVLVDFFNSLYNNNNSQVKPKSVLVPEMFTSMDIWKDFHKKMSLFENFQKDTGLFSGATLSQFVESEITDDVNIPENFDYESSDEIIVGSDTDENFCEFSQLSNNRWEDLYKTHLTRHIEAWCRKNPTVTDFSVAANKEKWLLFTAQLLSELGSSSAFCDKNESNAQSEHSIIAEFIKKELENSHTKSNGFSQICENTLKTIEDPIQNENNSNSDKKITVEDEDDEDFICEVDVSNLKSEISSFFSLQDDGQNLISSQYKVSEQKVNSNGNSGQVIIAEDSKANLENHLSNLKYSALVEIDQLCDIYDSMIFDDKKSKSDGNDSGLSKNDHSWDPTIEEIEDEMMKLRNRGKTREDFEQDLHIICFQLVTRNMLQELMPLDKDVPDRERRKSVKDKKSPEVQRKRRLIDGFSVDDYWVSIKSQFEKWRIIAMKMYTNLININKMTESDDPNRKNFGINFQEYFQKITAFIKGYQLAVKLNLPKSDGAKLQIKNSVSNTVVTESFVEKKSDSNETQNIYVETWFYALKEIERFEKKIKNNIEDEPRATKLTPNQSKKHFEETPEAELLAGKGLSKMISKCSAKKVPESNGTNNTPLKKEIATSVAPSDANTNTVKEDPKPEESAEEKPEIFSGPGYVKIANFKRQEKGKPDEFILKSTVFEESIKKSLKSNQENKQANFKLLKKLIKSEAKKLHSNAEKNIDSKVSKSDENPQDQKSAENIATQSQTKENDIKVASSAASKDGNSGKDNGSNNQECHEKCTTEGKCPLHPDSNRLSHLQTGDHPCNCCYCTVFGQVPPLTSPVSRNFNETRERLRTILNKKKLNRKTSCTETPATGSEIESKDIQKVDHQTNSISSASVTTSAVNKTNQKGTPSDTSNKDNVEKIDSNNSTQDESAKYSRNKANVVNNSNKAPELKQKVAEVSKAKSTKETNVVPVPVVSNVKSNLPSKTSLNTVDSQNVVNQVASAVSAKKNTAETKKSEPKSQKINQKSTAGNQAAPVAKPNDVKVDKANNSQDHQQPAKDRKPVEGKSIRCHSCSRVESKGIQTDTITTSQNSSAANVNKGATKNSEGQKIEQNSNLTKSNSKTHIDSKASSQTTSLRSSASVNPSTGTTHSAKSRDSSYCTSSICSGCCWSGYQDDRDVNMLVKFIEEPHRAVDKEKKQAKKARQKNKKLKMELLKERDELHEDLISMVGETSRLREEVVRLEQGLASACRRLPPANKCLRRGNASNVDVNDMEERECALLLKRAAQEASARATEAATLAEHAHSRLRHVESALNLLSSSVSRACVRQQKLGKTDEDQSKKAKHPPPAQSLSSMYNLEQTFYNDSDPYNNPGVDQGMVTIKRVILPNSEEPGVTITPKGSDRLIYTSQDHAMMSNNAEKLAFAEKQQMLKKQNLSWESTIAQINTLAHSKKKTNKPVPVEKPKPVNNSNSIKDHPKIEATKKEIKKGNMTQNKNTNSNPVTIVPQTNNVNVKKSKSDNIVTANHIEKVEVNVSKKALKKLKKSVKVDINSSNNDNKIDKIKPGLELLPKEKVPERKQAVAANNDKKLKNSNKVNENDNVSSSNLKTVSKDSKNDVKKSNQNTNNPTKATNAKPSKAANPDKADSSKSNVSKEKTTEKGSKTVIKENTPQPQPISGKGKKNQQQNSQKNTPATSQKTSNQPAKSNQPAGQNTPLQIVNSLSSAVDKIRLNDDTTIELATTAAKKNAPGDSNDISSQMNNKNAPVSSSIMEQLRSGVQFADLRLPPGITLTRVDPAKQHTVLKPNIPLMTTQTPAAYRPTPPAPPPPAVIMVDTTKLHADRESKAQAPPNVVDNKKTAKSKKSKKKNKKSQHHLQQASGTTSTHTSSVNVTDEAPKMVTLRNPMFHSTMSSSGMPTMQPPGKRANDIRLPDPIPMPPNASCQATITPTSNGMYTIRNPLMSIVHQQSMMGMNSIDNVPNPLLLMANQHLSTPAPHTYCANMCDDQNITNPNDRTNNANDPVNNLASRMSECSLEKQDDTNNFENPNTSNSHDNKSYTLFKHSGDTFSSMSKKFDEDENSFCHGESLNSTLEDGVHITPNPIGVTRHQEQRKNSLEQHNAPVSHENAIQKPIGTPYSQYSVTKTTKVGPSSTSSSSYSQVDLPEPQKLYTPFGPTDPDKAFGSILYQPFSRDQETEHIWSGRPEPESHYPNDDKARMSPYIHRLGTSRVIVDSDNSAFQQLDPNEQSKSRQSKQIKSDDLLSDSTKSLLQNSHTIPSSLPGMYQPLPYDTNLEPPNGPKTWSNGVYPMENEYYKYYQFPTGVSPLHHAKLSHSSSSSCVPSDTSSVYDSISNSSSNSPADSTNISANPNQLSEYPYMPPPHQISVLKSGNPYNAPENFREMCSSNHHEGFNNFPVFKNVAIGETNERHMASMWNDSIPQFKNVYGIVGGATNNHENTPGYDVKPTGQNVIGNQRLPNGLIRNETYFTDSSSIFAPDQSITNLNELDSSERDIESFKRFDFYFEPPKNKPKISLNVQDITFQRPSPTKPLYRNK
ncbi:uncharacterized protein LOC143915754 [Arctopsyche grandis]|uniref:uncharacterized protein LOC143915754 n=1 Tax=Arctopsyche grandis TaxID=121162 RepID=UPI00406DA3E4